MKYPELYMEGIRNVFFKWRVVAIRAFLSVYQSLILFYFVSSSSLSAKDSAGKIFGLWDVSTVAFTCVVVTVNLRLILFCNSITRWHYISVGGSILGWFIFVFLYSGIRTRYDRQVNSMSIREYTLAFPYHPLAQLTRVLSHLPAGECVLCHICLDEYSVFLHYANSSPCCGTFL